MAAGLEGLELDRLWRVAAESGLDLRRALAGSDEQLRPTHVAQPALLAVELALLAHLGSDVQVVGVAGHSVGEYAAAVAAGAITPEDALRLVVTRGALMAGMRSGAMSALLGLDAAQVEELCAERRAAGDGTVVVANTNAPGQTVVSGDSEAVADVERRARERGARRAVRLNVSGAFHSPLMQEAADRFAPLLDAVRVVDAAIPIVCNVDATAVTDCEALRERLKAQLISPVRWADCVERLVSLGAEVLVEVGPGSVLTALAKRITTAARCMAANSRQAMASLADVAVPT
jgi:[acyl-carrier-protein] S-malonyltransferase